MANRYDIIVTGAIRVEDRAEAQRIKAEIQRVLNKYSALSVEIEPVIVLTAEPFEEVVIA